ncbi:MAG TPA: murein biosynthesis integral membrane protein MurJ [Candidatus Moranbacteria bacterium]|nr:murein biosynthesis integral membrane protein MurJ [Candidatus Moranbacteria bacterium]
MIRKIIKNNFINSHISNSVASAAFLITVAGLVSRILGLFRDRLLASTFGAGDVLDAYYAAFRIPDLIYNLLILGALSAAFVPVFAGLIGRHKKTEAWELANGILNLAMLAIIILSLFLYFFTPQLMKLIAPGFSSEKMSLAVRLTQVMFLSPLFLGISGIFSGVLISFKRFLIYSLAPIFYNGGIIVGILVFVKIWGPVGLAWGVVLGAFLHMIIQYPAVRQTGFKYHWLFWEHLKNRNVRKVFTLMIPRTMGIMVNQVNLLVITIFASLLASGSLAVFSFAQNLQSVPLGIIGISFAIAVFPTLSSLFANKKKTVFIKAFSQTFRQVLFFVIPLSVFILLLRAQIVRVILGAGKFDWEDTVLTFQCLGIFSLSLFAQSVVPLLARTFYAMHNTKTPFYIALASEAVNILTVVLLIGKYKILSLAMAFSLASLVQMLLLLFFLHLKLNTLDDRKIIISISKIILATFFAGVVAQISKYLVSSVVNLNKFWGVFTQLSVSIILGGAVFLVVCQLIKAEEFMDFRKSLSKKIFQRKKLFLEEDTSDVSGI